MASIRSEGSLKKFVCAIRGIHWTRIESHDVGVGVPDLNGGSSFTYDFWIETKVEPKLRKSQYLWFKARLKVWPEAPNIFVLWFHEGEFYVIWAKDAVEHRLHTTSSVAKWKEVARNPMNAEEFKEWLTQGKQ